MDIYEFSRTESLIGEKAMNKLRSSKVAVFGIGGVGSYVAESLARCGIGEITLIDKDDIDITNINRQIHATHNTIGLSKTDVMKERILSINPKCKVNSVKMFYLPENADSIKLESFDYIADAIDNVTSKLELITRAKALNIPIISSMGTGNKLSPEMFEIADIYSTSVCPLCRVMRHELKKRNISSLDVVYSKEIPVNVSSRTPASISFTPPVAGFLISSFIIRKIIHNI